MAPAAAPVAVLLGSLHLAPIAHLAFVHPAIVEIDQDYSDAITATGDPYARQADAVVYSCT
jgi:hypothetical protein